MNKTDNHTNDMAKRIVEIETELRVELQAQRKIVKNALKLSIAVGLVSVFFVVLNLSILFTVAGGIAGTDRKLNALQEQSQTLKALIKKGQETEKHTLAK